MRKIKIPAKVRAGDAIRAQAWNEMVDALHALQAECASLRVRAGAGIAVEESVGGTLVKLSRRGAPAVAEEGGEYLFPFKVTARVVKSFDSAGVEDVSARRLEVSVSRGMVYAEPKSGGTSSLEITDKKIYFAEESGEYVFGAYAEYNKSVAPPSESDRPQAPSMEAGEREIDFVARVLRYEIECLRFDLEKKIVLCASAAPGAIELKFVTAAEARSLDGARTSSGGTGRFRVFATISFDKSAGTSDVVHHVRSDFSMGVTAS